MMLVDHRSIACGRFYNAFYQWHQLCNRVPASATYGDKCTRYLISNRSAVTASDTLRRTVHTAPQLRPLCQLRNFSRPTGTRIFTSHRQSSSSRSSPAGPSSSFSTNIPQPTPNSERSLSEHTRQLMRTVPHSVVVLTTYQPYDTQPNTSPAPNPETATPTNVERGFRGMTVSSLTTVTLDPNPIVSFNIKTPSSTYTALRANQGFFLVHFLHATPSGARIADTFTRGQQDPLNLFAGLTQPAASGDRTTAFERVSIFSGPETGNAPLLVSSGVSRVLKCQLLPPDAGGQLRAADHVVLLAEVKAVLGTTERTQKGRPPTRRPDGATAMGLMYLDRAYRAASADTLALPVPAPVPTHGQSVRQEQRGGGNVGERGEGGEEAQFVKTASLNLRRGDEIGFSESGSR